MKLIPQEAEQLIDTVKSAQALGSDRALMRPPWRSTMVRLMNKPRPVPSRWLRPSHAAALKARTLTNLYNQRPAWLKHAHRALDVAAAAAYGWDDYTPDLPDEEILRRLLALNLDRCSGAPPSSGTGTG